MQGESFQSSTFDLVAGTPLQFLPEEAARSVILLNGYLAGKRSRDGYLVHKHLSEWIASGMESEEDLLLWIAESFFQKKLKGGQLDALRRGADGLIHKGMWVAGIQQCPGSKALAEASCPSVLFGVGPIDETRPWVAIFNSRKPRDTGPEECWLNILKSAVPQFAGLGAGFATSFGTLTYDLVALLAGRVGSPMLVILPHEIKHGHTREYSQFGPAMNADVTISCMATPLRCPRSVRMVCRDRLLACIAGNHLVLEVRSGGNLLPLLLNQQFVQARNQWVYQPAKRSVKTEGNFQLLDRFPGRTFPLLDEKVGPHGKGSPEKLSGPAAQTPGQTGTHPVRWGEYLYHYTRACHGPWPGQTYSDYLESLLSNDPHCRHSALDTLIRMLSEGLLRAAARLVRGERGVVSWSGRSPMEFHVLQKWNPALIRWTFEPYGLAVKSSFIRGRGAKPVIYAGSDAYARLRPVDRFRFQRHEPPKCAWKHEREWRLPSDLPLRTVPADSAFIFVPSHEDAAVLNCCVKLQFPVISLSDYAAAGVHSRLPNRRREIDLLPAGVNPGRRHPSP